jgi:hypothetical protein
MEPNPEESFPNGKDPCTLTKPDTVGILVENGFARDSKLKGKGGALFMPVISCIPNIQLVKGQREIYPLLL